MNVLFNFTTQVEFTANTVQRGFIVHEKESSTDRTKASDHKEKNTPPNSRQQHILRGSVSMSCWVRAVWETSDGPEQHYHVV